MFLIHAPFPRIRVRVPATTSNLGPGFDILGMALKLYNEVELRVLPDMGDDVVEVVGEGVDSIPTDERNMVLKAARFVLPRAERGNAFFFRLTNRIPVARGLGSSAAARLGGVLAAHAFVQGAENWNKKDEYPLDMACNLEGHPDNVVPAYHGGICASVKDGNQPRFFQLRTPSDLACVVCVPDFELATEKARKVLPQKVSREDAVSTASRVAFLVGAIEQRRYEWLKFAMKDVIHQPYRRPLIPGMQSVIDAAMKAGAYGAALSGAGPSIFAFAPHGHKAPLIGRAMQKAFLRFRSESRYRVLDIDRRGVAVEFVES